MRSKLNLFTSSPSLGKKGNRMGWKEMNDTRMTGKCLPFHLALCNLITA